MNQEELSRIAQLATATGAADAIPLEPETRSGVSFAFNPNAPGAVVWPRFQVVWFYTVKPAQRVAFEGLIAGYENAATPATGKVTYLGTYSVTISAAAPDFEYRTIWGLDRLASLQELNDLLHGATGTLRAWLDLMSQEPAMRSEIMGRTAASTMIPRG